MRRSGASSSPAADRPRAPLVSTAAGGARVAVRVHPRARRNRVAGTLGDALKVEVTAAPQDGAANEAVVRLIAEIVAVPRAAVRVIAGLSSRSKTVEIAGLSAAAVADRLVAALP